jgi:SAM-dependent methyltransferase
MSSMSAEDRLRWDAVYAERGPAEAAPAAPGDFRGCVDHFPARGRALDVACGRGGGAVWLALRGLDVWGLDVSAVAIEQARACAVEWQVADRCRFDVVDLDDGLPPGPPVDVVICQRFRAPGLNGAVVDRLAAGGLLAISVLSEVDTAPGRYRARPGELFDAFGDLEVLSCGEARGIAWLLARKP